jgi:hypothetical protein
VDLPSSSPSLIASSFSVSLEPARILTSIQRRTIVASLGEPNHRGWFVMTLRVLRASANDPLLDPDNAGVGNLSALSF